MNLKIYFPQKFYINSQKAYENILNIFTYQGNVNQNTRRNYDTLIKMTIILKKEQKSIGQDAKKFKPLKCW